MKNYLIILFAIGTLFLSCNKEDNVVSNLIVVSSVSPDIAEVGDEITIVGNNFGADKLNTIVRFNFQEGAIQDVSNTEIKVIVPDGNPLGETMLTIIANGQIAQATFTYISTKLEVLTISPTSGKIGNEITIKGRNFSMLPNGNVVKFGDKEAVIIEATDSTLLVKVPVNPVGDYTIIVIKDDETVEGPTFSYSDYIYTVTTLAGSGIAGFAEGQGAEAQFYNPLGMAFDSQGNVLLVDKYNHRIRKITPDGTVSTIAGGIRGYADGTGSNAQFSNPYCIVLDKEKNAYITDMSNRRIRKMTPSGEVSTIMGTGEDGTIDGPALTASFKLPLGITIDKDDNIIISDYGANSIRKYNKVSGEVVTIAGGTKGYADGNGINAKFNGPSMIVVDENNNIIIADRWNYRIRKLSSFGDVTTIAGNGTNASVNGTATEAQFSVPSGIAIDYLGNYLVTDNGSHLIRKVTPEGVVTTFAGAGTAGSEDNGGGLFDATFNKPYGIGIDQNNFIYITEWDGNKVRKIIHD